MCEQYISTDIGVVTMRLTHHTDNDPLKYISKESFKIINNAIKKH